MDSANPEQFRGALPTVERRAGDLGHALPPDPGSDHVRRLDGYLVVDGL